MAHPNAELIERFYQAFLRESEKYQGGGAR